MTRLTQLLITASLILTMVASVGAADSTATLELPDPAEMTFEPLNFNTVEPEVETLNTGLEFWKIADQTLPLVTLIVDIDAGISSEPADKFGVGEMTASTLVRGGTKSMSAEEFTRKAELFGFDFNARTAAEFTQISVTCLAKDLNPAMMMLMDLIKNPGFDEKQLELVREEQIEQVKRMQQVPFFQAFNNINSRLYGEDHPRARVPDAEALGKITRDDLMTFHNAMFKPDISRFAVIGAADDAACKQLKLMLKNWTGKATGHAVIQDPKPVSEERTIVIVNRPGTQAVVGMAHLSVGPNHPDRPTLEVFNAIYGGSGMGSRLMNEVRTQKGLAYVVFGSHMFDTPTGIFVAGCMTKNESVVDAIQTMLDVTRTLQTEPVPAEELESVVQSMENSFIFKFERPRRVLQRMLVHRRMGLPDDYLATYLEKIRAVTPESIMKSAVDHIDVNKLQIIVAGPVDTLKPELEKLGWPVEVIDKE